MEQSSTSDTSSTSSNSTIAADCDTAEHGIIQVETSYKMTLDKFSNINELSDPKSIKLYQLTVKHLKEICEERNLKFSTVHDNLKFSSSHSLTSKNPATKSTNQLQIVKNNLNNILRESKLDKRESFLLSDADFDTILSYMMSISEYEQDEYWFSFESFLKLRDYIEYTIGEMYLPFWIYSNLYQNNSNGYISTFLLYNYVKKLGYMNNMRYLLSHYDTGDGFIKNSDFYEFIVEIIQGFKDLRDQLGKKYTPFYVCNITMWFFFFIDTLRTGKMNINSIITSGFLESLNENTIISTNLRVPLLEGNGDEEMNPMNNEMYWFSLAQMIQIYNFYLILDVDANGMISQEEFKQFMNGILTDAFVSQLFAITKLFDKQIDYKCFIRFIIAYNNTHTPQAIYYFFKLLDVNNDGYISAFDINYFYRDIYKDVSFLSDQPVASFEEITSEIFDMVKPNDPDRFSLKDLIQCNQGSTIIHLLISTEGYMNYEFKIVS